MSSQPTGVPEQHVFARRRHPARHRPDWREGRPPDQGLGGGGGGASGQTGGSGGDAKDTSAASRVQGRKVRQPSLVFF